MKELVWLILEPHYTCLSVASASHIVVLLLGPCNYLITGTFNFDRISFPFSLTVLAQDVLFQPLFYLYTSH
jgi:hypothetical protein